MTSENIFIRDTRFDELLGVIPKKPYSILKLILLFVIICCFIVFFYKIPMTEKYTVQLKKTDNSTIAVESSQNFPTEQNIISINLSDGCNLYKIEKFNIINNNCLLLEHSNIALNNADSLLVEVKSKRYSYFQLLAGKFNSR